MRVFGYARISTDSQRENTSIASQIEAIENFCNSHGHEILKIYVECRSGSSIEARSEFSDMIAHLNESDGIVAYSASRLFRNASESLEFAHKLGEMGKAILITNQSNFSVSVENPSDFLSYGINALVDDYNRREIVEKLKKGRQNKAKNGGYAYGSPRFGMQALNKELALNAREQGTITVIKNHYRRGKSIQKIADFLNADLQKYPTKSGRGRWSTSVISNILDREFPSRIAKRK